MMPAPLSSSLVKLDLSLKQQLHGMTRLMICLTLLLAMLGCQSLQNAADIVKDPRVSVTNAQIKSISPEGVSVTLTMDVDNPNPVPLNLSGFDYKFQVDGKQLMSGNQREALTISGNKQSEVEIPVTLRFRDLNKIFGDISDKDRINYKVSANAYVKLPVFGDLAYPASKSGELPLPKTPSISVNGFSIKRIGITSAKLNIDFKVSNPNNFGIDISEMKTLLSVNGKNWIDTTLSEKTTLEAKQNTTVTVPVNLNFLVLGSTVAEAIRSGEALAYRLSGGMVMDTDLPILKDIKLPLNVTGRMNKL